MLMRCERDVNEGVPLALWRRERERFARYLRVSLGFVDGRCESVELLALLLDFVEHVGLPADPERDGIAQGVVSAYPGAGLAVHLLVSQELHVLQVGDRSEERRVGK